MPRSNLLVPNIGDIVFATWDVHDNSFGPRFHVNHQDYYNTSQPVLSIGSSNPRGELDVFTIPLSRAELNQRELQSFHRQAESWPNTAAYASLHLLGGFDDDVIIKNPDANMIFVKLSHHFTSLLIDNPGCARRSIWSHGHHNRPHYFSNISDVVASESAFLRLQQTIAPLLAPRLTTLSIRTTPMLSSNGISIICATLQTLTALREFRLSLCNLNNTSACKLLMSLVQYVPRLESLDLSTNDIEGEVGGSLLSSYVQRSKYLKYLNVLDNPLGHNGSSALLQGCCHHHNLLAVRVEGTLMTETTYQYILDLFDNGGLRIVELTCGPLPWQHNLCFRVPTWFQPSLLRKLQYNYIRYEDLDFLQYTDHLPVGYVPYVISTLSKEPSVLFAALQGNLHYLKDYVCRIGIRHTDALPYPLHLLPKKKCRNEFVI
jgi:hypothetical protein